MESQNENPEYTRMYQEAARKVRKKIGFYRTLASYVIVCIFFWGIAIVSDGGWWPAWVMLGWGIGLAFQGFDAFAPGQTEAEKQRMIQEELRRMNDQP